MEATSMAAVDFNDKVLTMMEDLAQVRTTVGHIDSRLAEEHGRVDALTRDFKDTEMRLVEKIDSLKLVIGEMRTEIEKQIAPIRKASDKHGYVIGAVGALLLQAIYHYFTKG